MAPDHLTVSCLAVFRSMQFCMMQLQCGALGRSCSGKPIVNALPTLLFSAPLYVALLPAAQSHRSLESSSSWLASVCLHHGRMSWNVLLLLFRFSKLLCSRSRSLSVSIVRTGLMDSNCVYGCSCWTCWGQLHVRGGQYCCPVWFLYLVDVCGCDQLLLLNVRLVAAALHVVAAAQRVVVGEQRVVVGEAAYKGFMILEFRVVFWRVRCLVVLQMHVIALE